MYTHTLSTGSLGVPYVNVRGMSNQLHHPVTQTSPGVWGVGLEVPEDFAK